MLIKPKIRFNSVLDIRPDFLQENGIKGLILDLDNTLTLHGEDKPQIGVMEWLSEMRKHNIQMILVSNNTSERVSPTANKFSLPYIAKGKKPLTSGFKKARDAMHLNENEIASVGDQIFTDIICGNLSKMMTILVEPFEDEKDGFLKFKRIIQKKLFPPRDKNE